MNFLIISETSKPDQGQLLLTETEPSNFRKGTYEGGGVVLTTAGTRIPLGSLWMPISPTPQPISPLSSPATLAGDDDDNGDSGDNGLGGAIMDVPTVVQLVDDPLDSAMKRMLDESLDDVNPLFSEVPNVDWMNEDVMLDTPFAALGTEHGLQAAQEETEAVDHLIDPILLTEDDWVESFEADADADYVLHKVVQDVTFSAHVYPSRVTIGMLLGRRVPALGIKTMAQLQLFINMMVG